MDDGMMGAEPLITQLLRQMSERTEDAVLRILTGQPCACGETANHVEFGPLRYVEQDMRLSLSREICYFCDEHWPHDPEISIAEITGYEWSP